MINCETNVRYRVRVFHLSLSLSLSPSFSLFLPLPLCGVTWHNVQQTTNVASNVEHNVTDHNALPIQLPSAVLEWCFIQWKTITP